MKRYTLTQLAKAFLALREKSSPEQALRALAAALVTSKATQRLEAVVREINRQLLAQGIAVVEVASAHELAADLKKRLTDFVKDMHHVSHVETAYRLDPSLIGAFVVKTPTHVVDASLAHLLQKL